MLRHRECVDCWPSQRPPRAAAVVVSRAVLLAGWSPAAAQRPTGESGAGATIMVTSVKPRESPGSFVLRYGLTRDDRDEILRQVPHMRQAIPVREADREVRRLDRAAPARLVGTTPAFAGHRGLRVAAGRYFTDDDDRTLNNVAVIGPRVAAELFPDDDPVGACLTVDRDALLVIGVLDVPAEQPSAREVHVPLSTMRARWGDLEITRRAGAFSAEQYELSWIEVVVDDPQNVPASAAAIHRLLDDLHEDSTYEVEAAR